ncbi:MAG TPA: formate dehydrogenase, partial [Burkholderiales bacterium]|nr:formate dehydrogenase [Burkholderiales bacterium]
MKIYVPGDSGSLALGADRVAGAILLEAKRRGIAIDLVRNGSRGLYWLEPMVEIETENRRLAWGPVSER